MRYLVMGLAGLVLSGPANAQMYGPAYQKCSQGTTVAIVDCVNAGARTWDRRLNTAYRALLERSDPAQREPLKAAQRLWIRYRDANCGFYAAGEGSLRQVEAAECVRAMTQQRACELEAAATGDGAAGARCG